MRRIGYQTRLIAAVLVTFATCGFGTPLFAAEPKDLPPLVVEEPASTPAGMVWVAGGAFTMGTSTPPKKGNPHKIKPDEFPAHEVELDGYWMDETTVTNRQFAEFVAMTGHITFAEKKPTAADFAKGGVDASAFPAEAFVPASICFKRNFDPATLKVGGPNWEYQVWTIVEGANWRHPEGPDSDIAERMNHPVVHINYDDAVAYCTWAGKRLPTEAEFEYAASNGGKQTRYPWGNELTPDGKYLCNYWQGVFPTERLNKDGHEGANPVKAFPPNELGLYDMSGNVWEWCSDFYTPDYYRHSPKRNPQGPEKSDDPQEPGLVKRVQRGGSFMCNLNNCTGYRCGARMRGEVMSSSFHNGFRCVVDSKLRTEFDERQAAIKKWREAQGTEKSTQ